MYCSYEARKVIECLDGYGIEMRDDDMFGIERAVGRFYVNHVTQVLESLLKGGNVEKKLQKIEMLGWEYFKKPVWSMLSPRAAAQRSELIDIPDEHWNSSVYRMAVTGFCLADFAMKELALLAIDIPPMVSDPLAFSNAKQACRENRSIYYLHGVIRRGYQTAQGRIREIQQKQAGSEQNGWAPPEDFERMDVLDRKVLANDWLDRLNNIRIAQGLDK